MAPVKPLCLCLTLSLCLAQPPLFAHYESEHEKLENAKKLQADPAQIDPWKLLEMALSPAFAAVNVSITTDGAYRTIKSDGIPNHPTGDFPNPGNPNTISEQNYLFRMPIKPQLSGYITPLGQNPFGVAINGIPFDPGTAEWWNNDPSSGWHYEAMPLGPRLGLDENNAHVQPNGAYHYHGIPKGLLNLLASKPKPTLLGYAADGFPIYAPFGYSDPMNGSSVMKELKSSYKLKSGTRGSGPGGAYSGIFTEDYEYVGGAGDLDQCNGRFGITSEYPAGTYYYVITGSFPFIPRSFKGSPDPSFQHRGRPGGFPGRPGFGPPGMGGPPRPGFGPPRGNRFDGPGLVPPEDF